MSRPFAIVCLAASMSLFTPLALDAQPSDRDAVLATIKQMFDGMTEGDTAKMANTLDDGARLVQTFTRDGVPRTRQIMMSEFLARIANHSGETLLERYWDPEVRIHDNLATVWMSYNFYVGSRLDHCGEDAFQLARTPGGWKIIAIADTQRSDCVERP